MSNLLRSLILSIMLLTACGTLPQQPTLTPTRELSAPTLAPSPTVFIPSSDQLYSEPIQDGQNIPEAAALPNEAGLPPLRIGTQEPGAAASVQIVLENDQTILGDLYEQPDIAQRVPGVLIIGQDRFDWGIFPAELFGAGFTVLVAEIPGNTRIADLETVIISLSETRTVDPGRIIILGANEWADMALLACASFPICDAAVLLSPRGRDTLLNVLPNYAPRPLFITAGLDDDEGYATAIALRSALLEGSQFVEYANGSGTQLLALNDDLGRTVTVWLRDVFGLNE